MNNYDLLISKLDAFIRRYYANKLIKGTIIFLTVVLLYVLTVSVSEYFFYLPSWLRLAIAGIFIVFGLVALVVWVVIPLAKMARLGKVISHEQAATIIGQHFSDDVSDKLLNILQLKKSTDTYASQELIIASIDQKAKQISTVPLVNAIDLSKNRKYLPYLLPVLLIGVFILVAAPNVFKESSERLLQPTKNFERPAPFSFALQNEQLRVTRNEDLPIHVNIVGDIVPSEVFVAIGNDVIPMSVLEQNQFNYTFRNITEPIEFRLFAAGYYSKPYSINVLQKPILKSFAINVDYPGYTGKEDERLNSLSDLTVPVGSYVNWQLVAEYADQVAIRFGKGAPIALKNSGNSYSAQFRFLTDTTYTLLLSNTKTNIVDSLTYFVKVIPDEHPVLQLQELRDTVSGTQILLDGSAGDDYGISKVTFNYSITDDQNTELSKKSVPLKITSGALTGFQHYFDVQDFDLQAGQKLSYYIEAWDNDGVFGSKSTRSELMTYDMFNKDQLDSAINANAQQINAGLSNSSQNAEKLQDQYKQLENKLAQSKSMDFEQQQALQNMMQMQQGMQNEMKAVKKRFEEQLRQSKQKNYSQNLKDKQEQLKEQMDNLMNKELQEQMKKLQELMAKLNKQQAMKTMKQLQQQNKLFNMDMERMKELMKKMEMQMRMEDMANKMNELAQKELDLNKKTEAGNESADKLAKEQEAIKKELDSALAKDMKEMEKLNEQLKQQQNLNKDRELAKKAQDEMKNSEQSLKEGNSGKAGQSQKKAAQSLQSMSESLGAAASSMDVQQLEKDIKAVRQILTNLMRLSFDQENLISDIQNVNLASNSYVAKQHEQNRLHENSKMIRDSLFEMSKDMFALKKTVNKETTELEKNMKATVDAIENRRIGEAVTKQQYVMTHTNNLALMLNEVLSNLLAMQSQSQKGKAGSCNKPGGKTPKPGMSDQLSDVITKQKNLGGMMKQMEHAQQMRNGGQPGQSGGKDKKEQGSQDGENMSAEQLATLAQQQASIRRQIEELTQMLNGEGMSEQAKELREIQEEMDKNETQLVNKMFSSELFMRQQKILTRMLEVEKSVREQKQDDKRSSNTAKEISRPVPPELEQYFKKGNTLKEQYKTTPPVLRPYYKKVVEDYYKQLGI